MTQDEIIKLAKLAGWELDDSLDFEPTVIWYLNQDQLGTFAKLVAEKERERISQKIAQLPFGDTAQSLSIWVKNDI
jgi:hypothetical protein